MDGYGDLVAYQIHIITWTLFDFHIITEDGMTFFYYFIRPDLMGFDSWMEIGGFWMITYDFTWSQLVVFLGSWWGNRGRRWVDECWWVVSIIVGKALSYLINFVWVIKYLLNLITYY